ncbi:MAG: OB-fold nucleic acid binding domain-containing protein [Hyphomicrobiaceae bacterium]
MELRVQDQAITNPAVHGRRSGAEQVDYPSKDLEAVLAKTLGVPLFQEQAMQIAIVGAGFSPGEADRLRRAMATFRNVGTIHSFREKFVAGMIGNGYTQDFAERCFSQIEGFGEYGFPESHAASFAHLVYVSSWIKHHYPDAFCAAILNSQPMGFYAPAQLVRHAREHKVEVRHPDINTSSWDCALEPAREPDAKGCAVRLGLRLVSGAPEKITSQIVTARGSGYADVPSLWLRSGVPVSVVERLADADAFRSVGLDRRAALWAVRGLGGGALQPGAKRATSSKSSLLTRSDMGDLFDETPVALPQTTLGEHVVQDYASLSLSLKAHPISFFREELRGRGVITSAEHGEERRAGRSARVAGLVLVRQQPGTAKGVIFITLEDETGIVNVVVWPKVFEHHRRTVMSAQFLEVRGKIDRDGLVIHVIANELVDLTPRLRALGEGDAELPNPEKQHSEGSWKPRSRDFH